MSGVDNPSVFPSQAFGSDGLPSWEAAPGMTLRDWFAGQAVSGLLASEAGIAPYSQDWAAERAYLIADAMLAERSKAGDV